MTARHLHGAQGTDEARHVRYLRFRAAWAMRRRKQRHRSPCGSAPVEQGMHMEREGLKAIIVHARFAGNADEETGSGVPGDDALEAGCGTSSLATNRYPEPPGCSPLGEASETR